MAKKKEIKPISGTVLAVVAVIAILLMATLVYYIVRPSETKETNESYVGEQSFGDESSVAPPVFDGEVKENMSDAEIGDVVMFGKYEQNGKSDDGSENIEWIVLDKQDDKLLLVSLYCLDAVPYNNERASADWETSTLRAWLSDSFMASAFSAEEQASILETANGDLTDKLFVLSAEEANTYFKTDISRISASTKYADSKNLAKNGECCMWWVRDIGTRENNAMYVFYDGTVRDGYAVDYSRVGVRPAMWVSADAEKAE